MFPRLADYAGENTFAVDANLDLAEVIFLSTERLVLLNMSTARRLMEQATENSSELFGARDVKSLAGLNCVLAEPAIENARVYACSLYELANQTKAQISAIVESRIASANASILDVVGKMLATAPAGSEASVANVRTVIDAANSAYDSMAGLARQVADIAATNVITAGDSARKALAKGNNT